MITSYITIIYSKVDALAEDLDRFKVDQGGVNVDIMIEQYDKHLYELFDRYAPKKNTCKKGYF